MKKLLFYQYGAMTEGQVKKTLDELHISYQCFCEEMHDYHADSAFALSFLSVIHSEQICAVFSFDYFPLLSMLCDVNHIPYISWIYDCPHLTLHSKTIQNHINYIFCFDKIFTQRLCRLGARHCYHYPLAVRTDRIKIPNDKDEKYQSEISFLGNLYNGEKNRLRNAALSDYARGYVEGLLGVQSNLYGCNLIRGALSEAVVREITEKCSLFLGNSYITERAQLASDAVNMELSARDRENVLQTLVKEHKVDLYSGSKLPKLLAEEENLRLRGYADYETQMPAVFRQSKINLNVTSRTIESGIPLRVLDILSCGGFCITNYQPEIAELFEDGRELVMYTDFGDLRAKVSYYLEHDEQRQQIAQAGYEKICQDFELKDKIGDMLQIVGVL